MADAARQLLMYVVFPLWVGSGLADWFCHRAMRLPQTSGLRENLLHVLMFAEMGLAVLAMALLEINAAALLLVAACIASHEFTVWIDLRYSVARREVPPVEQMVHSAQELLPVTALALLVLMAWDQALALVGLGEASPDFRLRPKGQPWPLPGLLGCFALAVLANALPLAQETWACWRARQRH
ncbi:MAG: diguanylate cyclase [Comamonadaceae bacterium]|nr:MAG: diguanylate cyclase [Comamonadaceae bacterium]